MLRLVLRSMMLRCIGDVGLGAKPAVTRLLQQ